MGTVYATQRRNESWAAVKVLHPRFAHDKSIRARFLEEGYLANRVGHPAVVTILEDDIDEAGNFYIVMELLDGVDLGKFVGPPRTPISTSQGLNIAYQLLGALEKAHQKGIVHRDIKPANVMILRDGRLKLLDFGIAKALSADGTVSATEDDEEGAIGTDRYMSPEQGNGFFEDIDARSDLWSVGALLMVLLAGQDPSEIPLWDQSYEDRAWTFSRLGKDVPPHVVQIISLALQPQKSKRWVTAAAMREAIEAAHLDLYGTISRDALAELARSQLNASIEGLNPDPTQAPEEPVVIEPTYPSRPSHPPPSGPASSSPRTTVPLSPPVSSSQRAPLGLKTDLAVASRISPIPDSVEPAPSSEVVPLPAGSHFVRKLVFGGALFAMGAAAALLLSRAPSEPPSFDSDADAASTSKGTSSLPIQIPGRQPTSHPQSLDKRSVGRAEEQEDHVHLGSPPIPVPTSEEEAVKPTTKVPPPSSLGAKTNSPRPASTASPQGTAPAVPRKVSPGTRATSSPPPEPVPSPSPKERTQPSCNGLDGLFNVEHCQ